MRAVFFDLDPLDHWHRREVEALLSEAEGSAQRVRIAASRSTADYTVGFGGPTLADSFRRILFPAKFQNDFIWDMSDAPSGLQAGLYCSLRAGLHDPRVHKTFCYWLRFNELVSKFPLAEARVGYSFLGGITSGLRARMIAHFNSHPSRRREIRVQGGAWNAMFDRSGSITKREYADSVRRSRFVLCPRGNGVASIRLFEVMEAQRVPVIMSDGYVLPVGPPWRECALRVRERDLPRIEEIIEAAEPRWEQMAVTARRQWEAHFSRERTLDQIDLLISTLRPKPGPFQGIRAAAYKAEAELRSRIPGKWRRLKRAFRPELGQGANPAR